MVTWSRERWRSLDIGVPYLRDVAAVDERPGVRADTSGAAVDGVSVECATLPAERSHPRVEPSTREARADVRASGGLEVADADHEFAGVRVHEVAHGPARHSAQPWPEFERAEWAKDSSPRTSSGQTAQAVEAEADTNDEEAQS